MKAVFECKLIKAFDKAIAHGEKHSLDLGYFQLETVQEDKMLEKWISAGGIIHCGDSVKKDSYGYEGIEIKMFKEGEDETN